MLLNARHAKNAGRVVHFNTCWWIWRSAVSFTSGVRGEAQAAFDICVFICVSASGMLNVDIRVVGLNNDTARPRSIMTGHMCGLQARTRRPALKLE